MFSEPNATASYEVTGSKYLPYEMHLVDKLAIPDLFRISGTITTNENLPEIIDSITQVIGSPVLKTYPIERALVIKFEKFVVSINKIFSPFDNNEKDLMIAVSGSIRDLSKINQDLRQKYPSNKKDKLDWFFKSESKPQKNTVTLRHQHKVEDAFFPWIKPNLAQFQTDFLESDANVLLLMGEPGCGKTTFIRDLIHRNNLSTAVTYDEELMMMDSFFIEFMNRDYDLLVIEDADIFLKNREGGNKVMSKLLNASDGLIHTNKKIIFTANLTHLDEIDSALTRPGRCFEAMIFRRMTYEETKMAAFAAGLPEPDGGKTLSQLFANGHTAKSRPSMGFAFPQ